MAHNLLEHSGECGIRVLRMRVSEQYANTMKMTLEKFQRYEIIKLVGFLEGIRSSSSVLDGVRRGAAQTDRGDWS